MPKLLDPATSHALIDESAPTGAILEAASSKPGRFLVKIIDEGVGSSGVYPASTLEAAAQDRVFPAGLHMYVDHAASLRRGPGGERSVRDLAAILAEDARYDPNLKALVAEADIFGAEGMPAERLRDLADHIGVSISASAIMGPPGPGSTKPTVRKLVAAESVDFVTHAGRGGAIMAILESAKTSEAATQDRRDQLDRAVRDTHATPDVWAGVRDFDEATHTVWFYVGDTLYERSYEPAPDDLTVALNGTPIEVRAITRYVPTASTAGVDMSATQEAHRMPEISQAELDHYKALESQLAEARKRAEDAEARVAEADRREKITANRKQAAAKVAEATQGLPHAMADRITHAVEAQIGDEMPADLDRRITDAVEAEKAYAASLAPATSALRGFGPAAPLTESALPKRTRNAFGQPIKEA